jgi:hypothetical protein
MILFPSRRLSALHIDFAINTAENGIRGKKKCMSSEEESEGQEEKAPRQRPAICWAQQL